MSLFDWDSVLLHIEDILLPEIADDLCEGFEILVSVSSDPFCHSFHSVVDEWNLSLPERLSRVLPVDDLGGGSLGFRSRFLTVLAVGGFGEDWPFLPTSDDEESTSTGSISVFTGVEHLPID